MRIAAMLALTMMCGNAQAEESQYEKAVGQLAEDVFILLGSTYLCGSTAPGLDEHTARSMAEEALQLVRFDEDQAIIYVDDYLRRFKRENTLKIPVASAEKCRTILLSKQDNLRVSEARLRKIKGK